MVNVRKKTRRNWEPNRREVVSSAELGNGNFSRSTLVKRTVAGSQIGLI